MLNIEDFKDEMIEKDKVVIVTSVEGVTLRVRRK